ncbi:MAG: hypothetical protein V1815_02270 [Candidatus Woesearchaeota archaeon]
MAIIPKEGHKLSLNDKNLIAILENVIDGSIKDGTAHKYLNSFYIELPKKALSLSDRAKSVLLSKYKAAGWKKAEIETDGINYDIRENSVAIRLYE